MLKLAAACFSLIAISLPAEEENQSALLSTIYSTVATDFVAPEHIDWDKMLRAGLKRLEVDTKEAVVTLSPEEAHIQLNGEGCAISLSAIHSSSDVRLKLLEAYTFLGASLNQQKLENSINASLYAIDPHSYVVLGETIAGAGKQRTDDVTASYTDGLLQIRIKRFGQDCSGAISQILAEADSSCQGIVLDLRGNPGGYLNEGIRAADLFLDKGLIAKELNNDSYSFMDTRYVADSSVATQLPIIVIIDSQTASAAELFAAALKENGRATVIGQRSFGKGSVQAPYSLGDTAFMRLTVSYYVTANDTSTQGHGIEPDIAIDGPADDREENSEAALSAPVGYRHLQGAELSIPALDPILVAKQILATGAASEFARSPRLLAGLRCPQQVNASSTFECELEVCNTADNASLAQSLYTSSKLAALNGIKLDIPALEPHSKYQATLRFSLPAMSEATIDLGIQNTLNYIHVLASTSCPTSGPQLVLEAPTFTSEPLVNLEVEASGENLQDLILTGTHHSYESLSGNSRRNYTIALEPGLNWITVSARSQENDGTLTVTRKSLGIYFKPQD